MRNKKLLPAIIAALSLFWLSCSERKGPAASTPSSTDSDALSKFLSDTSAFAGADLIVYNAKITTQNLAQPNATALAVKGGRIYAVGEDAEILTFKAANTKVIDAKGRRLIPGLNDSHIHMNMEGSKFNYSLRWDGVPTLKEALNRLSEQAKRTPEGQWVKVIGGWTPYQFAEQRLPTMEELNAAVPNRPFIVQYAYNKAYLNKLAMDAIGVGKPNFPQAPLSEFEKDANGAYTGILYGKPGSVMFWMMESMVPQPTPEEQRNSLMQLAHQLNRFGLTSVIDAGGADYPEEHRAVMSLVKDNLLTARFSFMNMGNNLQGISETQDFLASIEKAKPISPGQNLSPYTEHGYEFEDAGETIQTKLLDYENFDQPTYVVNADTMRINIYNSVSRLVKRRIPFRIHATYNENISSILDGLEKVNKEFPFDGLRWALEHTEFISPQNIQRVKNLNGAIALQDKMAMNGQGFIKTHGKEKAVQTPPFRELLKSGIPLSLGTDGLRVATFNPWICISWAVTGKDVSGMDILAADNRLTREQALKLYTLGSAWFEHEEHEKGRIAPGNLADFVLLSDDFFAVSDEAIKKISSVLTVVDGKAVYGDKEFAAYAPKIPDVIPAWSPVKYYGGYYEKK